MNELEKLQKKTIKTIETMNSNFRWNESSHWTNGYHEGMIAALKMVLDWIKNKEIE